MLKLTYSARPIPQAIVVAGGHTNKKGPTGAPSLGRVACAALIHKGAEAFVHLFKSHGVPPHVKAQACYFLMRGPALPYGIDAVQSWLQLRRQILAAVPSHTQALARLAQRVAHYEAVLASLEEQQARSVERAIDTWQRTMEMRREYRFFKRERRHGY